MRNIDYYKNKYQDKIDYIGEYRVAKNASSGSKYDSNANVENKNITTMSGELNKEDNIGTNRLLMIYKLTEMYGEDFASEYIRQLDSHEIYKHDETSIMPYCVSITLYPFLFSGLSTIGGISDAPKNLKSFCGSFSNLVFAVASQFAGAVSTPEFLMYMDYFVRKEYGDDYIDNIDKIATAPFVKKQQTIREIIDGYFQQVVYSLNQPAAARNFQSVFWNIAYFDSNYFKGMFDDFVFPDYSEPNWETANWLQKYFMDWFNKERLKKPLTFPVETVNLLDDGSEYVDKEWADYVAEMYAKGHSFFTYRSNSVDSLASCCFDGKQRFISNFGVKSFEEFKHGDKIKVPSSDGRWNDAIVKSYEIQHLNEITLQQEDVKLKIFATGNHNWKLKDGNFTNNLQIGEILFDTPHIQPIDNCTDSNIHFQNANEWKVVNIKPKVKKEKTWCLEVENDHTFLLEGGVVTGNCRLRNELQDNTFSFTLGAGGISTGSKGVITINLNRLVQNATRNKDNISDAVRIQVKKCHKYLTAFNSIVEDNYNSRLLNIYDAGYISLEKQFLTIGVNGFVESAEFLNIEPNVNNQYFQHAENILKPIYEENKLAKTDKLMFNTEFVPKMCGHLVA